MNLIRLRVESARDVRLEDDAIRRLAATQERGAGVFSSRLWNWRAAGYAAVHLKRDPHNNG